MNPTPSRLKRTPLISLGAVAIIGLIAAFPLFKPQLIQTTDSLAHYYLLIQVDDLVQSGIYYSRWLPHRISGLGEPVFQYYPPLAIYVAELFKLPGLETLLALRLTFALTFVGGAIGIYLWLGDRLGHGAGLVGAALYAGSPHILASIYFRGGLTEQFALMLIPFTLWAFRQLAYRRRWPYLVIGGLGYGAIILSHNLIGLIFSPVLLVIPWCWPIAGVLLRPVCSKPAGLCGGGWDWGWG